MRAIDGDALSDWMKDYGQKYIKCERKISLMYIWKHIQDAPTIEPERETGKWVVYTDGMLHCSNCSEIPVNRIIFHSTIVYNTDISGVMKFCPNCGARMMISKAGGSNG